MEIKFGTDGWRGVMARDFTFDNVRKVAQAVANYIKGLPAKTNKRPPLIVGYDHRFQSEAFASEIAHVLAANGLKAVLSEEALPTPVVSLMTQKLKGIGLMVTASHNPATYNGIKIKLEGRTAPESVTAGIESCIDRSNPMRQADAKLDRKSFRKDYLQYLRSRVNPAGFAALNRPVVVDYLHGSSAGLMGELYRSKRLIELHADRDPLFGGLNPEPIEENLKELKERVLREKAVIGIALDGDGDRVGIVDDEGRYLSPCQVFPMLIDYLVSQRGLKGKIVQTVSLGYVSGRVAESYGMPFEEVPVGFKHIAEPLASGQAVIGGEESGGYAWKGGVPERDGLLTGLLLLEMCAKTRKTPSKLWEALEKKYGKSCFRRVDYRIHRTIIDKAAFTTKITKRLPKKLSGSAIKGVMDLDGVKIVLEGGHWLLMRPSGTEPLVRTYAETDSPKRTQELLDLAAKWVSAQL